VECLADAREFGAFGLGLVRGVRSLPLYAPVRLGRRARDISVTASLRRRAYALAEATTVVMYVPGLLPECELVLEPGGMRSAPEWSSSPTPNRPLRDRVDACLVAHSAGA